MDILQAATSSTAGTLHSSLDSFQPLHPSLRVDVSPTVAARPARSADADLLGLLEAAGLDGLRLPGDHRSDRRERSDVTNGALLAGTRSY